MLDVERGTHTISKTTNRRKYLTDDTSNFVKLVQVVQVLTLLFLAERTIEITHYYLYLSLCYAFKIKWIRRWFLTVPQNNNTNRIKIKTRTTVIGRIWLFCVQCSVFYSGRLNGAWTSASMKESSKVFTLYCLFCRCRCRHPLDRIFQERKKLVRNCNFR